MEEIVRRHGDGVMVASHLGGGSLGALWLRLAGGWGWRRPSRRREAGSAVSLDWH